MLNQQVINHIFSIAPNKSLHRNFATLRFAKSREPKRYAAINQT